MKVIINTSGRELINHALGVLEPGENPISEEREARFKAMTGLQLKALEGPYLEVKTKKTKKEDS